MSSSRPSSSRYFTDEELARYLNDDGVISDSDGEPDGSEAEDHLEVEYPEQTDEDDEPLEVTSTSSFNAESPVNFEEHVWSTKRPQSLKTASSNIVRISRGPTSQCRRIKNALQWFEMFIIAEIIDEVVQWTNAEIMVKQQNYSVIRSTQQRTDKCEIRALIGLLVLTATFKDNHLSTDELFDTSFSGSRYITTVSKDRFELLLQCLRFDDKSLRLSIQNRDRFVPIRKVMDLFIGKCKTNYDVGMYVTIDEQLLAFRGRCPFRLYIPNKPAKYGIKIVMVCDAGTKYMVNATPYLGKSTETGGLPLGEYFVKQLTQPLHGSNRNVTSDNWFTSIPLAKSLLSQPYKLTSRTRATGTSIFCYDGPLTLLSYKPKPNKVVYLLSSCSEEGTVNERTKKPNMVEFYNQTKGGVDTLDQMCSNMSCSRKTNRWPMCVFYGMLNIAFINSYVL
ncbi:hypothetical protein K1T71_012615 [Dendrolimus kikuchii]|uniref:Uncharacterized protein n=1 Tax=Dendrolimus kikuchii TaxID=765133 RepID=A0ACC1CK35_9NEOP|nr:hypothetical protein K1T71_012615 [Dendrolimus kikuchii]